MIVGVIGTFLLLIVALLGRWSRSTKLAAGRSAEFRPRVSGENQVGSRENVGCRFSCLVAWMLEHTFWLPLSLAFLNTTSAQVTAFCVEHLHQSRRFRVSTS